MEHPSDAFHLEHFSPKLHFKLATAQSEWFDGVDVHHVFFEGIHQDSDGVWEIYWGS